MSRPLSLVVREWPIVALLLLFGILYSTTLDSYGMFMWDEAEYASIARSFLRGDGFTISGEPNPLRPPILPLAGAATMWLYREQSDDQVLRITMSGLALLALLCVYAFARAAYDRTTAFIAAALLGLMPGFWLFVPYFMAEIPFLAFFAAAVWLFYFGAYRDERFFWWSWIAWGLGILTRYTATLLIPVLALFIPMAWWLGGPQTRRRLTSRAFFLSPLAGFLVLLPWLIREYVAFHDPFIGFRLASNQLQVYMPGLSMPWNFYLRRMPAMLLLPIAALFVAGALWTLWKRDRFAIHCLLTAAFILTWFSCYRYKEDRMVTAALPFMAVISALPLVQAAGKLRPLARSAVLTVLLAVVFVLNFRATRPVFQNTFTLGYPSFLAAMAFLRLHASPGALVLGANSPQIYWYSNLPSTNIPEEQDLKEALRHSEWVVISNFEPVQKPYVYGLLNRISAAPGSAESAARFQNGSTVTIVMRSDWLLRALGP
jgi:4-amino-4-deoxy-L-arabinose transferase-like glycosyltransferase